MSEKEEAHTLADAIQKVLAATKKASRTPGFFIFPLARDVASSAAGLTPYKYFKDYVLKTAYYKFGIVTWDPVGTSAWKLSFCLCCFQDGGQASENFDAITMLNYCSPKEIIDALKERVDVVGF